MVCRADCLSLVLFRARTISSSLAGLGRATIGQADRHGRRWLYCRGVLAYSGARGRKTLRCSSEALGCCPSSKLVEWLMEAFRGISIDVRTETTQGSTAAFLADLVVHAAGRVPDIAEFNLTAGTVEVENGRLRLNEYLQSVSNPIIYACGDAAAQGPPLTPVSSHDGKIVAANILGGNRHRPDYRGVPSIAFTLPPIAAVGLSEAAARSQAPKLRVNSGKATDWYTTRRVGEPV
jgi:hypothetical protein